MTQIWVDPVNEITAVLFVQLFPYDRVKLHKKFRDAVYSSYNSQDGLISGNREPYDL